MKKFIKYVILKDYRVQPYIIKTYGFKEFVFLTIATAFGYALGQLYFEPVGQAISSITGLGIGLFMGAKSTKTPKRNRLESLMIFLGFAFDDKTVKVGGHKYVKRETNRQIKTIKYLARKFKKRK